MKSKIKQTAGILLAGLLVLLTACARQNQGNRTTIDFTVVEPEKIPQELAAEIEQNKQSEIRMTFQDGDDLYLIRGYGMQKTGGYSIEVAECTEDDNAIWFDTRLLGPKNQERISQDPSYPVIVVKMEARDKDAMIS